MTEIWSYCEALPKYEVSNLGRVRHRKHKRIRKPTPNENGYLKLVMCVEGRFRTFTIHRLVAAAFCEKREDANYVDHINRLRADNRASNLRWVTQRENLSNRGTVHEFYVAEVVRLHKSGLSNTEIANRLTGRAASTI
ncbi:NUMOD4 domain-containing protein [Pseudarthrobacter sp. H2]|uniref:NUMOD4 domain-containing protein n=1 Tax=Pseudarthrobacter sp. H2 TaxID=3418415 RepID=UPI003CF3D10E